jgi:hypothetical protein
VKKAKFLPLFFVIIAISRLTSEEIPDPFPEEAPETLFQTQIGDTEAEFFLTGSWKGSVQGALGFGYNPSVGLTYPYQFPGMTQGFSFSQTPDLTASLWLMDRYFFETTFLEGYDLNSYLIGYQGAEDELLQSILIGNTDIAISPYKFLNFPGGYTDSPGLSVLFKTPFSNHELLLRYDPSLKQEKTFIGQNELITRRVAPEEYVENRFFVLPDMEIENLIVLIEDAAGLYMAGDGRSYRRAGSTDMTVSQSEGTIDFDKDLSGRVLVYYTKVGFSVGAPSLGGASICGISGDVIDPEKLMDFSWEPPDTDEYNLYQSFLERSFDELRISADGKDFLLLREPGRFSPFETANRYQIPQDLINSSDYIQGSVNKRNSDTGSGDFPEYEIYLDRGAGILSVLTEGESGREMKNRYPFAVFPGSESIYIPSIYGPLKNPPQGYLDAELTLQAIRPVEEYYLEANIIPGSVTLKHNGRDTTDFTVNNSSGLLTLNFTAFSNDIIQVQYRTEGGSARQGDIILGTGNTFFINPDDTVAAALGMRWNLSRTSYSTEPSDYPGTVIFSTALNINRQHIQGSLDWGISYSISDTTGTLRLLDMQENEIIFSHGEENIFPSSIPEEAPTGITGWIPPTLSGRGKLYYKNYYSTDFLGSFYLNPYTWAVPASQIFPYEQGSKPGPYTSTAPIDGIQGKLMILDFDFEGDEFWAGAQNRLSGKGGSYDLSSYSAISFSWKAETDQGAYRVFLQLGAIGEDLDGDGSLDEESHELSSGFSFDLPVDNGVLKVGSGLENTNNGILDSEDSDGSGFLDPDDSDLILTREIGLSSMGGLPTESFKTETLYFTPAERRRLKHANGIRIIVEKDGTGDASGRIMVGRFTLSGTSFALEAEEDEKISIREISESRSSSPAERTLAQRFPDDRPANFSSSAEQRILEIIWDDLTGDEEWLIKNYTTPAPPGQYSSLGLYFRIPELEEETAQITISMTDTDEKGFHFTFEPGTSQEWNYLQLNPDQSSAKVNGQIISGNLVIDASYGNLTMFRLSSSGAASGVMEIDELHLSQPEGIVGSGANIETTGKWGGSLLTIGETPIIENVSFLQRGEAATESFLDQETAASYGPHFSHFLLVQGDLLKTRISGNLDIVHDGSGTFLSGGHEIILPAGSEYFRVTDRFRRNYNKEKPTLSRASGAVLALPEILTFQFDTDALMSEGALIQNWSAGSEIQPFDSIDFQTSVDFNLFAENAAVSADNYAEDWINGFGLIVPWYSSPVVERRGSFSNSLKIKLPPLGLDLKTDFRFEERSKESSQTDSGLFEIKLPATIPLKKGNADIAVGYKRIFSMSSKAREDSDFEEDISLFFENFKESRHIFLSQPITEFFSGEGENLFAGSTAGFERAKYEPSFSLQFSRGVGSRVYDLFVPASFQIDAGKTFIREMDSLTYSRRLVLNMSALAINLFGKFGTYYQTDLYETDEFIHSLDLTISEDGEDAPALWDTNVTSTYSFFGDSGAKLTLDNTLSFAFETAPTISENAAIEIKWQSIPERSLKLPIVKAEDLIGAYLQHTERADLTLNSSRNNEQIQDIYLILGHDSSYNLSEHGYIKAAIETGFGTKSLYLGTSKRYLFYMGLSGYIEAKISY